MADCHQHLFNNLSLLHDLKPGSADYAKCIKENMFAKPNRTAFDQVLFYLCSTYDPVHYLPKVPWPILDRSQERTFRQNTVSFVKDIIKELPEARIPPFSPSFISTPGGERLAKFMWKFSLLVLKAVVERESGDAVLQYPTAGLDLLQIITDKEMEKFRKDSDALCQLVIDASTYAKKLSNDILNQSMELKAIRSELSDTLQRTEHCPLSEEEKGIILDGDKEQSDVVFAKWQSLLNNQVDQAVMKLNILKDQSLVVKNCYESVKTLVNSKTMPLVLDATDFPSTVKDADGKLDLSFVLSEGANATTCLLNSISMCGGFQSLESIFPQLEQFRDQLQQAEVSLTETKAGFLDLLSRSLENISSSAPENDHPDTPLKGNLQIGYEMLQDAQISTPPLVFDTHVDAPLKSRICAESPTIDLFPGQCRPPSRGKLMQEVGTPKTSQKKNFPGLPSANFGAKVAASSALQRKSMKPSPGFQLNRSPVIETPAFCPKQNATSTAYKPSSIASKKINSLTVPKTNSRKIPKLRPFASVQEEEDVSSSSIGSISSSAAITVTDSSPVLGLQEDSALDAKICSPLTKSNPGPATSSNMEELVKQSPIKVADILAIQKIKETVPIVKLSPVVNTPIKSPVTSVGEVKNNRSGLKAAKPTIATPSRDEFDSPKSSCGIFSPPSANNSFFSMDAEMELSASVPKFDLDFDDDISPSGRVSLCPPVVEKVTEEPPSSAKPMKVPENSRRKSLQALIHRYRDLVASSKTYEVPKTSPPLSPEAEFPEETIGEDINEQLDLNLDDLNL